MFLANLLQTMLDLMSYFAADPPGWRLAALFLILLAVVAIAYFWFNSDKALPNPSRKPRFKKIVEDLESFNRL